MKLLTSYLALEVAVVALAVAATVWGRRRRFRGRDARSLEGFEETDEIVIDPTTRIRQRVWFNPDTGERRYLEADRRERR